MKSLRNSREWVNTPDTVVLVYHKSAFDLKILRQLLESEEYHGILPTEKYCIPLLQLLRWNPFEVPLGGVKVPLALECLFPIMYPRSQLVGLNHQALVDCQQTRLVCMALMNYANLLKSGVKTRSRTLSRVLNGRPS